MVTCSKNTSEQQVSNSFNDSNSESLYTNIGENSSQPNSIDEKFAELEQEASDIAKNSKALDSGDLYEKIKNIHDDVKLIQINFKQVLF